MISTKEEIMNVATISANSDSEIGEIIASAMEKVPSHSPLTLTAAAAAVVVPVVVVV